MNTLALQSVDQTRWGFAAFIDEYRIQFTAKLQYGAYVWDFNGSLPPPVYLAAWEWVRALNANPHITPKMAIRYAQMWTSDGYSDMTLEEFLKAIGGA